MCELKAKGLWYMLISASAAVWIHEDSAPFNVRGGVFLFGQTDCTIFNYYWTRGERPDTLWQEIQNLGAPLGIANLVESWWYVGRKIWIFEIASSALGSPGHVFRGRAQPTTVRLYASEM